MLGTRIGKLERRLGRRPCEACRGSSLVVVIEGQGRPPTRCPACGRERRVVPTLLDVPSLVGRAGKFTEIEVAALVANAPTRAARHQRREGAFPGATLLELGADRVKEAAAARVEKLPRQRSEECGGGACRVVLAVCGRGGLPAWLRAAVRPGERTVPPGPGLASLRS